MSSEIYGLEDVLKDLDMTSDEIDEAMDDISKEVATEILDKAIENVNGPNLGNKKKGYVSINGKKYSRKQINKRYNFVKSILSAKAGSNFGTVMTSFNQPYPVAVRTGNLKRSLTIRRLGKNSYKVFADMGIANYACWVHDGTTRMKARPFLDDAVQSVMDSKKYLNIAGDIIDDILNK